MVELSAAQMTADSLLALIPSGACTGGSEILGKNHHSLII